ncbi:MAG TPA: hypothetical protein VNI84_03820 [Pyrinomonadaceae bacterium]|nr:hypothetical protein [Pyrinomonadaceae bacterium]
MSFTSVPFKIADNFTQISGVGKFSRAGVVLEYEGKIFGIIKSGVKESRIALDEILDVKFRKGVFKHGARIEIRLKSFTKLSEVPNKDGKITLKLERDDFERGRQTVLELQKEINETREKLPPNRTPVSSLFDESDGETENFDDK